MPIDIYVGCSRLLTVTHLCVCRAGTECFARGVGGTPREHPATVPTHVAVHILCVYVWLAKCESVAVRMFVALGVVLHSVKSARFKYVYGHRPSISEAGFRCEL